MDAATIGDVGLLKVRHCFRVGCDFTCHRQASASKTNYATAYPVSNDHGTLHIFKMVFYFTSTVVKPSAYIYVGKDKVESATPTSIDLHKPVHANFLREMRT